MNDLPKMSEPTDNAAHGDTRIAWQQGSAPVAVILISLNEAHNMEAVLDNLHGWAKEVFVVDSHSNDRTVDIALERGVHVVQRSFRGFGDQWNFALRELPVTAPWTMKMDPDERLSGPLKASIQTHLKEPAGAAGIKIHRRLWFMGKALPIRQTLLRLWRTGQCRFSDVTVNEYPLVAGPVVQADGDMEHHDSPDLQHWLDKQNRYSTAEAFARVQGDKLSAAPNLFGTSLQRRMWLKRHFHYLPCRYKVLFLYNYLVLGAWRAGRSGYTWAHWRSEVYRLIDDKAREIRSTGCAPSEQPHIAAPPDSRVEQYP